MEAVVKYKKRRSLVMRKSLKEERSEEQRTSRRLRHKIKRRQGPLD